MIETRDNKKINMHVIKKQKMKQINKNNELIDSCHFSAHTVGFFLLNQDLDL